MERQTCGKTKSFRTDCGGEFLNSTLLDYCDQLGIQLELTTPYTSQQNGLAERMHLTIFDKVRAMLVDSKTDKSYWVEAADTAVHVYNRTSHSATQGGRTPLDSSVSWGEKQTSPT
jgi:transposase InsO family protein